MNDELFDRQLRIAFRKAEEAHTNKNKGLVSALNNMANLIQEHLGRDIFDEHLKLRVSTFLDLAKNYMEKKQYLTAALVAAYLVRRMKD